MDLNIAFFKAILKFCTTNKIFVNGFCCLGDRLNASGGCERQLQQE